MTKKILLTRIPILYEGLFCYAPLEKKDEQALINESVVEVKKATKRSNRQNRVWALWYTQISRELGEDTPQDVKCFCKLHYGIPLYQAQDAEFHEYYANFILPLPYEAKLQLMLYLPVTSELNKEYGSIYTQTLQNEFAKRNILLEII